MATSAAPPSRFRESSRSPWPSRGGRQAGDQRRTRVRASSQRPWAFSELLPLWAQLALVGVIALQTMAVSACAPAPQPPAEPPRVHRIGFLSPGARQPWMAEFEVGLQKLGYWPGENVTVEYRFAEGNADLVRGLAEELVGLGVEVLVATDTVSTRAAKSATSSIPIVMVTSADPVGDRLVESLRRPGGNVTGLTSQSTELGAKRLELLRDLIPGLSRVAVLWNAGNQAVERQWRETEAPAQTLGIQLHGLPVRTGDEVDAAFEAASGAGAGALMVFGDPFVASHRARIFELAEQHRLPTVYNLVQFAESGGLMAYGVNLGDLYHRSAGYVDKLLRGNSPGDLPVEQPTKFELVINVRAAEAVGLTVPGEILARADRLLP